MVNITHQEDAIKSPVTYQFIPIRMATSKKQKITCWQRCRKIETLTYCWYEYFFFNCTATTDTSMEVFQKIKTTI